MANYMDDWSFGQCIGWAAGGAIGCGLGAATLGFVTALGGDFQLLVFISALSGMFGAIGGVIGGVIGYALAHFFHEPWASWQVSSSFLFGLFISLLIFSLIAFPSSPQYSSMLEHERLMIVVGFIAAVIACGLGGILNMLKVSRPS